MRSIVSESNPKECQVLLLGAGGRLGGMLCGHWPRPGALQKQSRKDLPGMLRFDPLSDTDALKEAASCVQAVVCLSGVTPAHAAATGDAMHLNTDLACAAIAAAPEGVRVFLASSAAVYGAADGPHLETDPVSPVSSYGAAKRAMEQAALAHGEGRICVLRIGNVAGADAILGGWRAGMTLDRLPDGRTPRRSYIGPKTLARVIYTLCLAPEVPQILNIAAPGLVEMGDLLDSAGLAWAPRAPQGPMIEEVALGTALLERLYKFAPDECTSAGMVAQWREGRERQ